MNRDDAFIGQLEHYLETFDGATPLPDRVRDALHAELPRTRQARPAPGMGRIRDMIARASTPARIAMGVAAVVAFVVLGGAVMNNGRGSTGVGGAPASPSPSASPSPTPTPVPTPAPTPILLPADGSMVDGPGSFQASEPFPIPFTVTLPAGWVANVGGPNAAFIETGVEGGVATGIGITLNQKLYADPCNDNGVLDPQPGPTVDDLAIAMASLPGLEATIATDVVVDGYRGKQLTLTAPDDITVCPASPDRYRAWTLPPGSTLTFNPGQQTVLSILDVDGQRLVISSDTLTTTTPQVRAEVQQILDSIRFVRTGRP